MAEWPVDQLSDDDIQLVEDYLYRRTELENGLQLGQQILRRMLARMAIPEPRISIHDRVYFLAQIMNSYRQDE